MTLARPRVERYIPSRYPVKVTKKLEHNPPKSRKATQSGVDREYQKDLSRTVPKGWDRYNRFVDRALRKYIVEVAWFCPS
jgi:hypothetical protein